jgi:hypothetical protein
MSTRHTIFFIHGMGDNEPRKGFEKLWAEIRQAYGRKRGATRADFDARYEAGFVDWHEITKGAELELYRECFRGTDPQELKPTSLLHPVASARTFMTFFLGDVVAYVAENDNHIRRAVWAAMRPRLRSGGPYSIVAHSLGSVIAFDFLFNLYEEGKLFWPVEDPEADIADLQQRMHGLFTMGSPIGLFMMRRGDLWGVDVPAVSRQAMFTNLKIPLPRADQAWLYFWDKDVVIAYPLEQLFARNADYNRGRPLSDREVTTGWNPVTAHLGYWNDDGVARAIAEALP